MGLLRRTAPTTPADKRPHLRALAISDTRPNFGDRTLADVVSHHGIDLVITVGDLHRTDIAGIDQISVPSVGVYGNHCDRRYLEDLSIVNLQLSKVDIRGVTFTGLEGCVRYKEGTQDALYTQSEYSNLARQLPAADVLVTHCPPRGINDHPADPAHVGITALRSWIDAARPRVLIHGHTHPQVPITSYGATRIEYVYGARLLTI